MQDLISLFLKVRRTPEPTVAHERSSRDLRDGSTIDQRSIEEFRQFLGVVHGKQQTRWSNTLETTSRIEINVRHLAIHIRRDDNHFSTVKSKMSVPALALRFPTQLDSIPCLSSTVFYKRASRYRPVPNALRFDPR
jgi:hypothetical protein